MECVSVFEVKLLIKHVINLEVKNIIEPFQW